LQTFILPQGTTGKDIRVESTSHHWFKVHEILVRGFSIEHLYFTPVDWSITLNTHGEGVHTIFMLVDAHPLVLEDVRGLYGSLIWENTRVSLCAEPPSAEHPLGRFIQVRGLGDGFLRIGDGFQSDHQCHIGSLMQSNFDRYGLPNTACIEVRRDSGNYSFCRPLMIID